MHSHSPTQPSRSLLSTTICWIVIASFVAAVAVKQANNTRRRAEAAALASTPNLGLEITARFAVGQSQAFPHDDSPTGKKRREQLSNQLHANIKAMAISPVDKLKSAIIIRELQGAPIAVQELDADHFNDADASTLRMIYTDGPATPSPHQRRDLVNHLGWLGQLALTQGLPADHPDRIAALAVAHKSFIMMIAILVAIVLFLGLGFFLLIFLIVLFSLGKQQFSFQPPPAIGPPAFLESFAIWGVAYLVLSLLFARWKSSHSSLLFELLFAAITLLIALWPLLRGTPWPQLRHALGWHTGRGILTEMAFGFVGYLAGLPILAAGVFITLILTKLTHASPTHPIQQELAGDLPLSKILALLVMISIAAPLLEETMFRGALYFHLRRRWRPWFSAGLVALVFAAIHPQGWAAIPVLGSIAITLALLREWRSSLLASITAHGINNAVVLMSVVLILK